MNIDKDGFQTGGKYSYFDLEGKYGVGGDEWVIPLVSFPNSGKSFAALIKNHTDNSRMETARWDTRLAPVLVVLSATGQIRLCVGSM